MNIKKVDEYSIGLDIGTNSVGWAVIDSNGDLCKYNGKNTWGVRLFDRAETAAATRMKRITRRRYARRKQRLEDLRAFLLPEIQEVDPDFFGRMSQSFLWEEDRGFAGKHALFADTEEAESEYYARYKTIYHLRNELVQSKDEADIRLVYLALHHAIKYRGHFLIEQENLSAKDADGKVSLAALNQALDDECERLEISRVSMDAAAIEAANELVVGKGRRTERKKALVGLLGLPASEKKMATAISDAVFTGKADFSLVFEVEKPADSKFSFSDEEKVETFEGSIQSDEQMELFQALKSAFSACQLGGILQGGGTLSANMVRRYEEHETDLRDLKHLVRTYCSKNASGEASNAVYNKLFKGSRYADGTYKKDGSTGYTGYILGKVSIEDLYKEIKKAFKDVVISDGEDAKKWERALARMEEEQYLKKLRTSDNGSIPHQLHLEEVRAILENQAPYHPCLAENKDKIEKLLSFRLPYYVGPLGHEKNPNRAKSFAWSVRKEGTEGVPVKPWNFRQVIDEDKCAELFITNLTGECSYYLGKKAIPKNSLLYSEFCVRQELNGCRVAYDGENFARMDVECVDRIFESLFKSKKKVKVGDVRSYLRDVEGMINTALKGTQKENEFASSMGSYIDFKRILGRDIETYEDYEMVEELITWVTVFEDKKILERKIRAKYGEQGSNVLSNKQIKAVCKLRYTGWSRLSKEFLTELRCDFEGRRLCIMDVLRDSRRNTPMILMEILSDKRFGFNGLLEAANAEYLSARGGYALDEIPGSPAIKRGINQSIKIVQEIIEIAGHAPTKICVEMAREEEGSGSGRRTTSRDQRLRSIYKAMSKDLREETGFAGVYGKLDEYADRLREKRLFLYFLQGGKCEYCGKPLDVDQLQLCHVDHIVPQSLIKDDSIDNTVLCCQHCNEEKLDSYPVPSQIQARSRRRWEAQKNAGLMTEKKYRKLTEYRPLDRQMGGFINRQLVETRQISKHVVNLLQSLFEGEGTKVETIKAELSSNLRKQYGFYKSRELNDYHHAHDAYLACQMSRFLSIRYPRVAQDLEERNFGSYTFAMQQERKRRAEGSAPYRSRGNSGLFVNSFGRPDFDPVTGEILEGGWDAQFELGRIRKCLGYKDCFVSYKLEKLTGKFWDQNAIGRREGSKKAIPLKQGFDCRKYGYYTKPVSAYCAVVSCREVARTKSKRVVSVEGVPVSASYRIKGDRDLLEYFNGFLSSPEVLKAPVFKFQKIEWNGVEYYLSSSNEVINAGQLCVPARFMPLLDERALRQGWEKMDGLDVRQLSWDLFEYLCEMIPLRYPRQLKSFRADETRKRYESQGIAERQCSIVQLLSVLHADSVRGCKNLGLSGSFGRMKGLNLGSAIEKGEIVFIDTSVTGMRERRSKLEL